MTWYLCYVKTMNRFVSLSAVFFLICVVTTSLAGDHISSDGNGGYWTPCGGHVSSDGSGGYWTREGHVSSDGSGGYWTPGGGHVSSDGNGGYWSSGSKDGCSGGVPFLGK